MEKIYDKRLDLYCKHITNHSHCKCFPYNQPLDNKKHDNLQKIMLFIFHDKDAQTTTSLAHCQSVFQKNLEECVHDNF